MDQIIKLKKLTTMNLSSILKEKWAAYTDAYNNYDLKRKDLISLIEKYRLDFEIYYSQFQQKRYATFLMKNGTIHPFHLLFHSLFRSLNRGRQGIPIGEFIFGQQKIWGPNRDSYRKILVSFTHGLYMEKKWNSPIYISQLMLGTRELCVDEKGKIEIYASDISDNPPILYLWINLSLLEGNNLVDQSQLKFTIEIMKRIAELKNLIKEFTNLKENYVSKIVSLFIAIRDLENAFDYSPVQFQKRLDEINELEAANLQDRWSEYLALHEKIDLEIKGIEQSVSNSLVNFNTLLKLRGFK